MVATMTWLAVTEYLYHKLPRAYILWSPQCLS